jgi:hypothetical protein
MNPLPLPSSAFAAWAYDPATKMLRLQFTDGEIYSFADVPPQLIEELLRSSSPGKFFNGRIRGRFVYSLITTTSLS